MSEHTLKRELDALRRRVEALESRAVAPAPASARERGQPDERFWLLETLRQQVAAPGAVAFGGIVDLPGGEHYEWQWAEPVNERLASDWRELAAPLEALGHPVRLAILQTVLAGQGETAELAELPELGTRGQLYHHLKSLEAGGWIQPKRRGEYTVPAERVVPLLTILAAIGRS